MKVNELYQLAEWYEQNVINPNLSHHFKQINDRINILLKANKSERDLVSDYNSFSKTLCELIEQVNTDELSIEDINVLKKMGLEKIILNPAVQSLQSLFEVNTDIHNISARITSKYNKLLEAKKMFGQILNIIPIMTNVSGEKKHTILKKY